MPGGSIPDPLRPNRGVQRLQLSAADLPHNHDIEKRPRATDLRVCLINENLGY